MPKQGARKHSDVNGMDFVYSGSKWEIDRRKPKRASDFGSDDYPLGDW